MSVIDILFRVDSICHKYDKYDIDKQRELNAYGDDAFARLYAAVESTIQQALHKSEIALTENNRAAAAALNAEVRRSKGRLMDEVPKLRKLANKKVKGLSNEEMAIRRDLVLALPERIQAIPDGITGAAANQTGGWAATSSNPQIKFDSDGNLDSDYFHQSEQSNQYRQEYEMRKMKQDEGLDIISEGLDTLKNLAHDMNEEMDRQVPLMDEIDTKVDRATADLKNTNVRLKKTLTELRSSRNFCIDIILLCVLLGIVMYIYNQLR
ncbi:PREDICTED: syntaxin-71-like [Lupinus angustifolius]|uniref:syntaxin-71-like n=1 Tax=Lupinus angustifolius TaxID=3871 RepID=UPI00092F2206|nr:PREDICTED: syntaxin-71-like [Lupinus angustifolius]